MPGLTLSRILPAEGAGGQGSRLRQERHLDAFTQELGTLVSLSRWQRGDNCDAVVAAGGVGWILSGIVLKSLILECGQRRIVDLMMRGDFCGLSSDHAQVFSFEAVTDGTLTARISREDLGRLAVTRPLLYQYFHERSCETIVRLEDHILVQGGTTATQKVAAYLIVMLKRLSEQQGDALVLPMSRYDIADHVGIAVETVSRAMTELRRLGIIELESPR